MGRTILLAEDDAMIREDIVELLEREGYLVRAVADGESFQNEAMNSGYSLILTDNHMPGKNGLDALAEIMKPWGPNTLTPAILMTGAPVGTVESYFSEVEKRAREVGVSEIVRKPFAFSVIRDAIGKYTK